MWVWYNLHLLRCEYAITYNQSRMHLKSPKWHFWKWLNLCGGPTHRDPSKSATHILRHNVHRELLYSWGFRPWGFLSRVCGLTTAVQSRFLSRLKTVILWVLDSDVGVWTVFRHAGWVAGGGWLLPAQLDEVRRSIESDWSRPHV